MKAAFILVVVTLIAALLFQNIVETQTKTRLYDPGQYDPGQCNRHQPVVYEEYVGQLVSDTVILPLIGKRIQNCNKWNYFAVYKKYKLPVTYENKDCYIEYVGCNEIRDGAKVTVPEYANQVFIFKSIRV